MCGDLSFSLNRVEAWGSTTRVDRMTEFYQILLEREGLMDFEIINIGPTWRNNGGGLKVFKILREIIGS